MNRSPTSLNAINNRFGTSAAERLRNRSIQNEATGCLLWQGSRSRDGYGMLYFNGRPTRVHRVAWILSRGPIPAGLLVCHHCDTPCCVNVDHLYLGTDLDNARDTSTRGRWNSRAGELNPRVRLTKEQAESVLTDPRNGPELAAFYGVNRSTINRIRRGETWQRSV